MAAAAARSGLSKGERVVEGGSEEPGSGDWSGFGRDGFSLSLFLPSSHSISLAGGAAGGWTDGARARERTRVRIDLTHIHIHTHTTPTHIHTSHPTHSVRIKQATVADVVLDDADVHVFASCIFGDPCEADF